MLVLDIRRMCILYFCQLVRRRCVCGVECWSRVWLTRCPPCIEHLSNSVRYALRAVYGSYLGLYGIQSRSRILVYHFEEELWVGGYV